MGLRGGRYETLGVIASGGMATVHLGRALGAGGFERLVAIKTMHPHLAEEPEFVAMFLDEARLAARIRHPNVVGTIDVQQDEVGVFLVMEYVEGPSLMQIQRALKKEGGQKLPLDIVLRVFLDALAGLHAAHELTGAGGMPLNLVHRDVSPQNILVGVDGIARLTDFGVARAEARLQSTSSGQLKGKLGYMAPEQLRRETVDRRADIYAAGVLLWELLTGAKLISGDNEAQILVKNMAGDHLPPRAVNPAVPAPLDAACMRALQVLREERYATAAEFAEAIDEAIVSSGATIASPRAVAALVKGLGAHVSPSDLLAGSSGRPSLSPRPLETTPPPPGILAAPARTGIMTAESAPARPSDTPDLDAFPGRSKRRGKMLTGVLAGVGLVAVAVAAGWSLLGGSQSPPQTTPAIEAAPAPPPPAAPSAEPSPASSIAAALTPPPPDAPTAAPTASAAPAPPVTRKWPSKRGRGSTNGPYRPSDL
ncbi:serine/threonine-protein kinase [Polyangium aurulentum]|uniref:serine/threonine-protein kinase n=1 Tax=Polyangium aurulentum TaxID=2567896 RepID=UPI0010AE9361|nr:serine/threonine-protein kinase [Polyangium aurulentum]UQA59555.1 serine/threonine protein kinase [Polyangium aurulentum]